MSGPHWLILATNGTYEATKLASNPGTEAPRGAMP